MDNNINASENLSPQSKDKRGFAITSLVLGIVSLVLFCLWYISVPCAILAIIFGSLSIKSSGRGMAIAGIVTSIVALAAVIIAVAAMGSFITGIMNSSELY